MVETEWALCYEHMVDEPFTPGVDFWACGECWHVWPTQADFQKDIEEEASALGLNGFPQAADPRTNIYSCPLCSHDW